MSKESEISVLASTVCWSAETLKVVLKVKMISDVISKVPMQERWIRLWATFALLPPVIMQVSGSKFTLNQGFMGFLL